MFSETVSKCCQWLLGCGPCLETWFGGNSRCPIYKNGEGREKQFVLKGFDDFDAVIVKLEDNVVTLGALKLHQ